MSTLIGRNEIWNYQIRDLKSADYSDGIIGNMEFTFDFTGTNRTVKIETIFNGIKTLMFEISFYKEFEIASIDAEGVSNGDKFYLKCKGSRKKLSLSFESKYENNHYVQKMKKHYLENNTLMFLLKDFMESQDEVVKDVYNPMITTFIATNIRLINPHEFIDYQYNKIECSRYGITTAGSSVMNQFFIYSNKDNKLMKAVCGNIIFEII